MFNHVRKPLIFSQKGWLFCSSSVYVLAKEFKTLYSLKKKKKSPKSSALENVFYVRISDFHPSIYNAYVSLVFLEMLQVIYTPLLEFSSIFNISCWFKSMSP